MTWRRRLWRTRRDWSKRWWLIALGGTVKLK